MLAVEFEGLGRLGVRTERFEETVRFYRNGMGLRQIRLRGTRQSGLCHGRRRLSTRMTVV